MSRFTRRSLELSSVTRAGEPCIGSLTKKRITDRGEVSVCLTESRMKIGRTGSSSAARAGRPSATNGSRAAEALMIMLVLVVALSGCSSPRPSDPSAKALSVAASPALTEEPTALPHAVSPRLIYLVRPAPRVARSGASGLVSAPWVVRAISGDRMTITVEADQGDECDDPRGIAVKSTSDAVELWSYYQPSSADAARPCSGRVMVKVWSIRLVSPLGKRKLIHAPAVGDRP
jgi:hypothetical protein